MLLPNQIMPKNKIALITGASRGIGAATAICLAENGYDVAINYLNNQDQAEAIASKAREFGVKAITIKADLSKEAEITKMFATIDQSLGVITALVNNGGVSGGIVAVEDLNFEQLENIYQANVFGTFICSREAIKRMKKSGGAIVNVSSLSATNGGFKMSVYSSSKAAINNFTVGLSKEVAEYNIRVNAVSPGVIDTETHQNITTERLNHLNNSIPLKRMGKAKEVAEAILWLLSDQASYVTGAILPITGGK